MSARDGRMILAGVALVGFALFGNYLNEIQAGKWATVASLGAVIAALYSGLDVLLATETSLLFRINKWWTDPGYYRSGALLLVIGCLILAWLLINQLVNSSP